MKITRIVLTGGPCAGKTTGMSYIKQKLGELGYIVFIVPEAATICINGGVSPINFDVGVDIAQEAIIKTAYHLENSFLGAACRFDSSKKVVILYDRGIVDCLAYMDGGKYCDILEGLGLNPYQVKHDRYKAVIHMRTAADGAEEFYTLENNEARYETAAEAIVQDNALIDVWTGHPHFRIVGNEKDFEWKIRQVFREVCAILGEPVPLEQEHKFAVDFLEEDIPEGAQTFDIEQVYLLTKNPENELRVRRRSQDGNHSYYETLKRPHSSGARYETERMITKAEYEMAVKNFRDPDYGIVRKRRTCFVYNNQYFELDTFLHGHLIDDEPDGILELECTDMNKEVDIPCWINVNEDVTGNEMFSNRHIARLIAIDEVKG